MTVRSNGAIANTESRMRPFDWHIKNLTLAHSQGQGQGHAHFYCKCLATGDGWGKHALLPTNRKSYTVLTLAYLYLTLANSKGQGQDRAHSDREYL